MLSLARIDYRGSLLPDYQTLGMHPPTCTCCSSKNKVNSLAGHLHLVSCPLTLRHIYFDTFNDLYPRIIPSPHRVRPATPLGCSKVRLLTGCGQVASPRWSLDDDTILISRNCTRGHPWIPQYPRHPAGSKRLLQARKLNLEG